MVCEMRILFVAMNNMGNVFSGGDRIWIELYNQWIFKNNNHINRFLCLEAENLLFNRYNKPVKASLWNILIHTLKKVYYGIKHLPTLDRDYFFIYDYIYSVSDFYPDLLPALIYKRKHPKTKWIAGYYLIASPFWHSNSPYKGKLAFRGFLYWLSQRLSLWLVNKYADIVYVTSEPERKYFPNKKVVVVKGGVLKSGVRNEVAKYDAIYIGRFHYQKGTLGLMEIWREVRKRLPEAKLVMVGDGVQLEECKRLNKLWDLGIHFTGFLDGEQKYVYIQDAKLVLHPATFDSGGMSCADAMAFGLPAIGYNLEAFETYYAEGMAKCKSQKDFVETIIDLLTNQRRYDLLSKIAYNFIQREWLWKKRAEDIWRETTSN
jgi:glycosyltransferase involved in cell wall biosynthesis